VRITFVGAAIILGGRPPAHFLDSVLDAKAGRVPGMTYSGNRSSRAPAFLLGRVWAYLC